MKEITSRDNDTFKSWLSLTKSKGLKESPFFLLSGSKLVDETLKDSYWSTQISGILFKNDKSLEFQTSKFTVDSKATLLSPSLFDEIDVLGTKSPILIVQQPKISHWNPNENPQGLEILCPLGDPQNLGALVRTSYAFGVSKIILLKECAHPFLPKSVKSSSGAVLKIPLHQGPSLCEINNNNIVALDLQGSPLNSKKWPKDLRLLIGQEGLGIPESFSGERMTLPMKNPLESLNAAVAAGIAIYALS